MKEIEMKKKFVLFGASINGTVAYRNLKHKYNVSYFVDNDNKKWGSQLEGIRIMSPDILISSPNEYNVIITSQYDVAIAEQLINIGVRKFGVYDANNNVVKCYDYSNLKNIVRKKNKISLIMNNNSGSNTYALYKFASEEIKNKYEIVLIRENDKNNDYYLDIIESSLVVRTHDSHYNELQKNVQLFHGFVFKGISYMNKYSKENKEYNHKNWSKLDAIASYSKTYNTFMNACYGVDGGKYIITGMPRNDLLLKSNGREKLAKLLKMNIDDKKLIYYMPTFRETVYGQVDGNKDNFNILTNDNFNMKKFDYFLETFNLKMIIKLHPVHTKQAIDYIENIGLKNIYALEDMKFKEAHLDLYEVMNAADLLITDYSSIYFDFLLLERPIIFTPLDLEEYEKNRGFLAEPYDFWAPGPKCYTFEQLTEEILKCLNDNGYYQKERQTICNIVHHYKDANSSERVWKLIDELMENS